MINFDRYKIRFLPVFQKDLSKLSLIEKEIIRNKLSKILSQSVPANIKKLKNYPLGTYRLRIGNFRLFFNQIEDSIVFTTIKNRRDLY